MNNKTIFLSLFLIIISVIKGFTQFYLNFGEILQQGIWHVSDKVYESENGNIEVFIKSNDTIYDIEISPIGEIIKKQPIFVKQNIYSMGIDKKENNVFLIYCQMRDDSTYVLNLNRLDTNYQILDSLNLEEGNLVYWTYHVLVLKNDDVFVTYNIDMDTMVLAIVDKELNYVHKYKTHYRNVFELNHIFEADTGIYCVFSSSPFIQKFTYQMDSITSYHYTAINTPGMGCYHCNVLRLLDKYVIFNSVTGQQNEANNHRLFFELTDTNFHFYHYNTILDKGDYLMQDPGQGVNMVKADDSSFYFVGRTNYLQFFTHFDTNTTIIGKMKYNLEPVFIRYIKNDYFDVSDYITVTSDGGLCVWGPSTIRKDSVFYRAPFLLKLDSLGNLSGVEEEDLLGLHSLLVYPNPGYEKINLSNGERGCEFEMYDIRGNKVLIDKIDIGDYEYDVSKLPEGVYFYVLKKNGIVIDRGKWIKGM